MSKQMFTERDSLCLEIRRLQDLGQNTFKMNDGIYLHMYTTAGRTDERKRCVLPFGTGDAQTVIAVCEWNKHPTVCQV